MSGLFGSSCGNSQDTHKYLTNFDYNESESLSAASGHQPCITVGFPLAIRRFSCKHFELSPLDRGLSTGYLVVWPELIRWYFARQTCTE